MVRGPADPAGAVARRGGSGQRAIGNGPACRWWFSGRFSQWFHGLCSRRFRGRLGQWFSEMCSRWISQWLGRLPGQ
jgi:hypothetical protein